MRSPAVLVFGIFIAGCSLVRWGQAQPEISGKKLFEQRCGGCHALDRDKEGPRLRGVYGRAAASVKSFHYSDALKQSGIKWNDESLENWLTDPEKLVPNNDMAFQVAKSDERSEIIAYLKENR
jgi:cytochrome c